MLFGKIVFYVVTSLVTVMLAHIAELHGEEGKQKKILFDTCIYTLILSCICFIPLNIFSGFFIKVVFTTKYLKAEEYMLLTSLISLGLSFLSIFMNFMIAKNKQGLFVKVIAIALSLLLGVSKFFSKAPSHTLTIIVFTLLGTTVFCGIYCFGTKEQIRHNTKI